MRKLDLPVAQQPADCPRNSAAWDLMGALHEKGDLGPVHEPTQALIELLERLRRRPGRKGHVRLGKRRRSRTGRTFVFRNGGGEGGDVCTSDALEKCMTPRSGGREEDQLGTEREEARRIRGMSRRTRGRRKEGTLSTPNSSDISDCVLGSIWSESRARCFRASSATTSAV